MQKTALAYSRYRACGAFAEQAQVLFWPLERWRGYAAGGEHVVDFFRRVWSPYLKLGLTSAQLRRLDRKLWFAIRDHRRGAREWPADLAMPTRISRVARALKLIEQGRWAELSDSEIIAALRKRQRQDGQPRTATQSPLSRRRNRLRARRLIEENRWSELSDPEIISALRARRRAAGREALVGDRKQVWRALEMIEQGRWAELTEPEILSGIRKRQRNAAAQRDAASQPIRKGRAGVSRTRQARVLALVDERRWSELSDQEIVRVLRKRHGAPRTDGMNTEPEPRRRSRSA